MQNSLKVENTRINQILPYKELWAFVQNLVYLFETVTEEMNKFIYKTNKKNTHCEGNSIM